MMVSGSNIHHRQKASVQGGFWLAKRNWSFLFLLMIFVSEFFMGAVFDLQFYGALVRITNLQSEETEFGDEPVEIK